MTPTAWYWPTGASGPVPCRWEGWVDFGGAAGRVWLVVSLLGD